ncbi:MAG TPA: ABC transporter substrate-binding protein [Candidatus Tectomicrobia bacterium]|nr:ABC transporter substrate-binding protein [Candidatus Tectomicrobia bacterium]
MRRGLCIVLALALLPLAWPAPVAVAPAHASTSLRIAMVLWRGETDGERGFRNGLEDLGYAAEYVVMNANQDRAELGRLLREILAPQLDRLDYVYVFGTTATLATKSIVQDRVPIVFNIVADPVGAGIVRSAEVSGGNIAGVTNEIPLPLQIRTARTIVPFTRLGLLFNPREKNSMLVRDKLAQVAQSLGIEVVDLRSPPAQDMLQANLQKLRSGAVAVDAVYLPADSFIVSRAKQIGAELAAAGIKTIAALESYIDQGALLGVVPDYQALGRAAAGIVHRHQSGERLHDMAVEGDREPVLKINAATSRALKVEIPDAIRKRARFVE